MILDHLRYHAVARSLFPPTTLQNAIDNDELVIVHMQHQYDPFDTDGAFLHAGEKTVAVEVVESVDIQLT